jgi:hypothetical protein
MSDSEDPNKELDRFKKELKKKKQKLTVPEEFLDGANSYDDKLTLVKILTEKEKMRVLLIIKSMLSDAVNKRDKK